MYEGFKKGMSHDLCVSTESYIGTDVDCMCPIRYIRKNSFIFILIDEIILILRFIFVG